MSILRFHQRKLCIVIFFGVCLVMIVVNTFGSGKTTDKIKSSQLIDNEDFSYNYPKSIKIIDKPILSHRKTVDREQILKLNNLLLNITEESKCPTCLGSDLCEDISSGFLSLVSTELTRHQSSITYNGNIGVQHPVLLQVPDKRLYKKVEEVLCGRSSCDVKSSASRWPYITSVNAITPAHITKFLEAMGGNPITHPLMICTTPLSVSVLESSFTTESVSAGSGVPTPADKMNLLTAVGVTPGYAVQKMAQSLQLSPGIVSIIGSCGRTWVTGAEDLTPLTLLLDEEWPVRAALGAQLLGIVEDMLEGSDEWLALMTVWSTEFLSVSGDGELLVTDASHTAIVDRAGLTSAPDSRTEDDYNTLGEICNRECFERHFKIIASQIPRGSDTVPQNMRPGFRGRSMMSAGGDVTVKGTEVTSSYNEVIPNLEMRQDINQDKDIVATDVTHSCAHEDIFAHLMYASVCAYIFSDEEAHQNAVILPEIPARRGGYKGLLHSAPPEVPSISTMLSSCIDEVIEGGRLKAAEELKEVLAKYGGLDEEEYDEEDDDE